MEMMADRFLRLPAGVVDAATGSPVMWRALGRLERPEDERRWLATCGTLIRLWHEDLPPLVDFGWLDDRLRYEAFAPATASGRAAAGEGALDLLREAGIIQKPAAFATRATVPEEEQPRAARPFDAAQGRPELVAGRGLGGKSPGSVSIGMRLLRRAATERVAELLDEAVNGRPMVVGYVGEAGSGVTTFLRDVAREATAHGFVPVDVRMLRRWPALAESLSDRHVLLIADAEEAAGDFPERALMSLALRSARGHIVLRPVRRRCRELRVVLEPFGSDVLAAAVHIWPKGMRTARAISAAAARSAGQPAAFVRLLRGVNGHHAALRVAEARPEYRVIPAEAPLAPDVAQWVRRGEDAARLARRGRHAAARRALDECSAALRRRGHAAFAAACEVRCGELLLARGDTAAAETLFRRAHADLDDGNDGRAEEAVVGIAESLLANGSLEQAEALLRAAREQRNGVRASILLAECLRWQARYDQAERIIGPALEDQDPLIRAAALRVLGEIAVGRHAIADAGRAGSMAVAEIDGRDAPSLLAAVHELMVVVQGHVADREAVGRHVGLALASAREARHRLQLVAVRLARLEALCRCGETPNARAITHLDKLADGRLPALFRARVAAVLSRVHPCEKRRSVLTERVTAFARATGARSLEPALALPPGTALAREASALIHLVSTGPDPRRLIEMICEWLRGRFEAASVAVLDLEGRNVAWCGRPGAFAATARSLVSRQPVPPWLSERGLEAAAPIEYGGELQGVLGVRWTIAGQPPAAAISILVTASACAAPALHMLRDRQTPEREATAANGIVGRSPAIVRLHDAIRRAGAAPFPVLIEGESGAGKELVARALHAASARRSRPFSAVNCASFQDDLFEAELFGHARGAFTGAHAERPGLFEQADGGTLFLDEISELTPRAQAKLLRALQEGEIRRLGENGARKVDVRVIAASNRPLADQVKAGRFRQDLLFRVAVIRLTVPPLRERREDVPLLAATIWSHVAARTGTRAALSSGAVAALSRHHWPGNVRELQNVIAALAVQVPRGRVEASDVAALVSSEPAEDETGTLEEARRCFERRYVGAMLARCGGRQAEAARALGITRQGLAKLMRRLSPGSAG